MKKACLLYFGNILSNHGLNKGVIETLGPLLEEDYDVFYSGKNKNKLLRLFEMIISFFRYSKKVDYILIDTYSSTAFWYAWIIGLLSKMNKIRYIPILHGGSLPQRIENSKWFCDSLFSNSYTNVAVSHYLKATFDLYGYKTIVIPNNIEIYKYQFFRRPNYEPKLLWVRSFHKIYNPIMAADVMCKVLERYPDAKLCMVGPDKDGSLNSFLTYCNQKGIYDHVIITGLLKKNEWHILSNQYSIFINTTDIDNTPVSVIEAMALGLPVISTNVGGLQYLLEHNVDSLLVDAKDVDQMYNAVCAILDDYNKADELVCNAINKVKQFDWNVVKEKWYSLLSK